jgi:hypothetical protein
VAALQEHWPCLSPSHSSWSPTCVAGSILRTHICAPRGSTGLYAGLPSGSSVQFNILLNTGSCYTWLPGVVPHAVCADFVRCTYGCSLLRCYRLALMILQPMTL